MRDLVAVLKARSIELPAEIIDLLTHAKSCKVFNTVQELVDAATGGPDNRVFEVAYDVPGKGRITEAVIHKVTNGISANFIEPYMRRRDPNTMLIADAMPNDKQLFKNKMGY